MQIKCYAWALLANHAHLLLRTGAVPIATLMRRLLTGYVVTFNRRHRRTGHLFQNRYKSIVCQEERYFLELVRYLHLNPLRAGLVADVAALDRYPYAGHSAVLGRHERPWQDVHAVLQAFARSKARARRAYRDFVQAGVTEGRRPDLVGGGLLRSLAGWASATAVGRGTTVHGKSDERILGDPEFVDGVLAAAREQYARHEVVRRRGLDIEGVAQRVAALMRLDAGEIWKPGRDRPRVAAKSLLCYWAVRELGQSQTALARRLGVTPAAVGYAVRRGERLAAERGYALLEST
jgi:hypothetical protein